MLSRFGQSKEPQVFVLGHQKSGTSAIAALLAAQSDVSVTIDLRGEIADQLIPRILAGEVPFKRLIRRNRSGFAATVVKHPNLTLLWPQLMERFPTARYVFVVRDPRQTIRSIFDRLQIPGDKGTLSASEWERIPRPWRSILSGQNPSAQKVERLDFVDVLAERWNLFVGCYVDAKVMRLVRYEDFLRDKVAEIEKLGLAVGLPARAEVSHLVDRQYQPRGAHRGSEPIAFFGPDRLAQIEQRCWAGMSRFGYA